MRTTIEFDDDTAAEIERLRRDEGMGVSEAVNELVRRGMLPSKRAEPFRQQTRSLGLRLDVSNVADALDVLEGETRA